MNEQDTAQPVPDTGKAGGGEPRPSLTRARLVLGATLGAFIFAGAGLIALLILILVMFYPVWVRSRTPGELFSASGGNFFVYAYPYMAIITVTSIALFLMVLLMVLRNHWRGTPESTARMQCACSAMGAAIVLTPVINTAVIVSNLIVSLQTLHPVGALLLPTVPMVIAIRIAQLLSRRARRLRMLRNTRAEQESDRAWRIDGTLAMALVIGGIAAAIVGAINYEPIPTFDSLEQLILGPSNGMIFWNHIVAVRPILVFSNILWQFALWLLLPLTLMASDSYLLLRQRLRQEAQATAP